MRYRTKDNSLQTTLLILLGLYVLKTASGINLSESFHAHDILLKPNDVVQDIVGKYW